MLSHRSVSLSWAKRERQSTILRLILTSCPLIPVQFFQAIEINRLSRRKLSASGNKSAWSSNRPC